MRTLLLMILLVGPPLVATTEPKPPATVTDRPTGPLSAAEERFQGDWKAYDFDSNRLEYAMTFEGRAFRARVRPDDKNRDERYEGYVVIRPDEQPAQIDFVILVPPGEREPKTSKGIFYVDGETIVMRAPHFGEPRPRDFKNDDKPIAFLRLRRGW